MANMNKEKNMKEEFRTGATGATGGTAFTQS